MKLLRMGVIALILAFCKALFESNIHRGWAWYVLIIGCFNIFDMLYQFSKDENE